MPSLSVVAAITLPDGLINTTVTFAIPTLFASTIRPVTFTLVRKRADTFLSASSDGADVGAGSDFDVSTGVGVGVGSGVVVGVAAAVGVGSAAGVAVGSGVVVGGADVLSLTGAAAGIIPSFSLSPSSEPLTRLDRKSTRLHSSPG